MSRLPGLGFAQSLIALVFLAAIVVVGAASLGVIGNGPAGASPSPTSIAAEPTATDGQESTLPPSAAPPSPIPESTPTAIPSGDVIAYTNPDGISPEGFAGDDYPFIEQARALRTFAGVWAQDDGREWHVAVTQDIPGAIEALKAGIPRGITVFFHLAQYTEAEVCALRDKMFEDRDELMRHGVVLTFGGCGNREERVNVGMSPISPEAIAYMQQRYPGPVDYENGGALALRPVDPPEGLEVRLIAVKEGEGPNLQTCGRRPFPVSGPNSAPIDLNATGPAFGALREALDIYVDMYGDLSSLAWRLVEQDDFGATFLASQGDRWLEAPVLAGTSGWAPGTIDECTLRALGSDDAGPLAWALDSDFPAPTAASTELHVLVGERACHGFGSPANRTLPPVARYDATELRLTVMVRPLSGPATCPGTPPFPVTIVLPEPLGDRDLVGASQLMF